MPTLFKTELIDFSQRQLFPSNRFDLLPEGHHDYLFRYLLQQVDTHSIAALYSAKGQNAYHPKKIISILICD